MNLAECKFKDQPNEIQRRLQEIVDKVVSLNKNLEGAHCRFASFSNPKIKKLYYIAIWDGRISHDPHDVVHCDDKSKGSLHLLGMSNVEIQMGSMKDRIPCYEGDVVALDFTGPGYFLYREPLLKHGIKLPWHYPQHPQPSPPEMPSHSKEKPERQRCLHFERECRF